MIKLLIFDAGEVFKSTDWDKMSASLASFVGLSKSQISSFFKPRISELQTGKLTLLDLYISLSSRSKRKVSAKEILRQDITNYAKFTTIDFDVVAFLKVLKKYYRMVCLTNTEYEIAKYNLKTEEFRLFDKVYCSCLLGLSKPDKRLFQHVLKDQKVKPDEVLFVDDNKSFIVAARKMAIRGFVYTGLERLKEDFARLDIIQQSSGGIIMSDGCIVLSESMKNPRYRAVTFPKGHMNPGEDDLEAAYREIKEETGLVCSDLALVSRLGSYFRLDGTTKKPKEIRLFLFAAIKKGLTPMDSDNPSARWVKINDVAKILTFKEDKMYWNSIKKEF